MVARFADVLGESKIPVLDLAGNQDELGKYVTSRIQDDFSPYGLQVMSLMVENISLPPEVEQAMDKRTSMGVIGNLQAYTQFQTANAIPDLAKNPGGIAASAAGLGIGLGMGQQISNAMNAPGGQTVQSPGLGAPPPSPEWGAMLAEGRSYLGVADWITFFPGLAIFITVLAFNLLGDGLRDALDQKLR